MTRSLSESLAGGSPAIWAADFLRAAGFPTTPTNVRVVISWEFAESSGGGGMWNPLNTTQGGYPGETNFNSVGVKNYARREDGIAANARVIHNGYYRDAVAAFEQGDHAQRIVDAITRSPWGTRHIQLVDPPPVPPPAHSAIGDTMQIVCSPQRPTIPGRRPTAKWNPARPNVVILENGASVPYDQPHGGHREWAPVDKDGKSVIPPGVVGEGIAALVGADGKPTGKGFVLLCSGSNTYDGMWNPS